MGTFISANSLADIMGTSLATTVKWGESGLFPFHTDENGKKGFLMEELTDLTPIKSMLKSHWEDELDTTPARPYSSVELFAGAGGLALGMHMAGFRHVLLNEVDPSACQTLRLKIGRAHV